MTTDDRAVDRAARRIRAELERRRRHLEDGGDVRQGRVTREQFTGEDTPIHVVDQAFHRLNREGILRRAREAEGGWSRGTGEWQPKIYQVRYGEQARRRALDRRRGTKRRSL